MEHKHDGNHSPKNDDQSFDCAKALAPQGSYTITLPVAQSWCTNWINLYIENILTKLNPGIVPSNENVLRGFFIPQEDIAKLAAVPNYAGARAYLAVDEENTLKILLVPVMNDDPDKPCGPDNHCTDLLCTTDASGKHVSQIYDFTMPCPVQCEQASALFVPLPPATKHNK